MFTDSTTNTALCRWSLLFVFLSSSVQITFDGCPEIHMHHPSHLRMKPQPLENNQTHCQLSHKKERRKKKKKNTQRRDSHTGTSVIHQHDQDFRTINHHGHHAKCRPQKQHIRRADEYVKKCLVCWKECLHAARTFSRSRNPMGGTPYLQMWHVYLIRSSYQWITQQGYMSQRNNSSSFVVLHSWTTILQPNFSYSHHDRSTHAKDVLLVHGKSCSSIDYTGWNSSWTLQLCDWKKNRIRCVRYYIRYERGEWFKRVSLREPIPTETFCHKSVVYDSSTDWHFVVMWDFCLQHPTQPIQWQVHPGLCPTSHQRKYTLHLKFSTSTKFSFYQQRWLHSRTHLCTNVVVKNSWSINPIVWCHAGSRSSQKPVGFCTEIGQWYGFGPGQHQGHSCLAQDDDLTEQSGLGLHSCNTRGSLYHYRSWMLHRVNGSNRELEQNPTRHSWSFRKITPDDWR